MNKKLNVGVRNIIFALATQGIILVIGFFKSIIMPSQMTVSSFGYWQMYLFYISYVGFFFLGYNDAILLKYNKFDIDSMPEKEIRSGNFIYILVLLIFSSLIIILSFFTPSDKSILMRVFSMSILVWGIYGVLIYLYLVTNNIKKYSLFNILDQIIFLLFICLSFVFQTFEYKYYVWTLFFSKLVTVLFMIFDLKKFIFGKLNSLNESVMIYMQNVKVGIFVMLSLIFSIMMSSFGKIIIDLQGNIEHFASFSFALSISSLIVVFVSAIGTVLFPILSRMEVSLHSLIYQTMMESVKILNYIGLITYFLLIFIIQSFFPQYYSVSNYLNFLFLAVIIQNKVSLIYNTYYKILRQERYMLIIYSLSIGIPFICALVLNYVFSNITIISIFTLIAVATLDNYSNYFFSKKLNIPWLFSKEYIVYASFLLCTYIKNIGVILFFFIAVYVLFKKRKDIIEILKTVKK